MKELNKSRLSKICKENDVVVLRVFGSFSRGDYKKGSDIDLVVRFSKPKSLLSLIRIEREFSEMFGRKVDLLTEASISPYLRNIIKKELKVIYES